MPGENCALYGCPSSRKHTGAPEPRGQRGQLAPLPFADGGNGGSIALYSWQLVNLVGAARQARAGAEIPSARFGVIFELMIVIGSRDSLLSIKEKGLIGLFHYIEKFAVASSTLNTFLL